MNVNGAGQDFQYSVMCWDVFDLVEQEPSEANEVNDLWLLRDGKRVPGRPHFLDAFRRILDVGIPLSAADHFAQTRFDPRL